MNYKIIKKKVKRITIKISEEGQITVTTPSYISEEKIKEIVYSKEKWIKSKLSEINDKKSSQSTMYYLGESYEFLFWERKDFFLDMDNKCFNVNKDILKESLHAFYSYEGNKLLPKLMKEQCEELKIEINSLSLKWMKTRWGSCNPKKRYINLNYNLMKYPRESIKYVIIHELCHIYHPNHSKEFWGKVSEIEPNYKELQNTFKTTP